MNATTEEQAQRIQNFRSQVDATTTGPWKVDEFGLVVQPAPDDLHRFDLVDIDVATAHMSAADAVFIAASRTEVPWVLDLAERQGAAIQAVRDQHQEHETFDLACNGEPMRPYQACSLCEEPWPCTTVRTLDAILVPAQVAS